MPRHKPDLASKTICLSCYGVRFAVEFDALIPRSKICSILPPESIEIKEEAEHHFSLLRSEDIDLESRPTYLVKGGPGRVSAPESLDAAVISLRKKIHLCVGEHAEDRVFIHAGVIGWNGQAIICPGRSHAGKSTLVWSMLNSGATYYSDEYAVLDRDGRVHPFPIPINLRTREGYSRSVAVDRIGAEPLSTSLILFARYQQNRRWEPKTLTPGQTVLRLIKNSLSIRRNPVLVLEVLKKIALTANTYAGERGEADTVVNWLRTLDT